MSRYISKLPPEIRELAEKRRSEQNPESKEDNLGNIKSFNWSKTPERSNFWNDIYQSNYSVFYTLYPQKDKLDELIEWMEDRRLFSCLGNSEFSELEYILNKAKEIKDGK